MRLRTAGSEPARVATHRWEVVGPACNYALKTLVWINKFTAKRTPSLPPTEHLDLPTTIQERTPIPRPEQLDLLI